MDTVPHDTPPEARPPERLALSWGKAMLDVSGAHIICVLLTIGGIGAGVYLYEGLVRVTAEHQRVVLELLRDAQAQRTHIEERQQAIDGRFEQMIRQQIEGLELLKGQTGELKIQTWLSSLPFNERPRLLVPPEARDRLERARNYPTWGEDTDPARPSREAR